MPIPEGGPICLCSIFRELSEALLLLKAWGFRAGAGPRTQKEETMSNMSYCRFQNTVGDLNDCHENMDDDDDDLGRDEKRARSRLIRICVKIADDYRYELEDE